LRILRDDAAWLIEQYRDEIPALPGLPYTRLGDPGPYRVVRREERFRVHDVLGVVPQLAFDGTVVRPAAFEAGILHVEPAAFSDGVKSNYAMDGPGQLRDRLRADYGARLPPLNDARLSNAVGTAVVVFDGDGQPYLPRRAPRQCVFPGGYHCTASGETVWSTGSDFDGLFTTHTCRELEEEVGRAPISPGSVPQPSAASFFAPESRSSFSPLRHC